MRRDHSAFFGFLKVFAQKMLKDVPGIIAKVQLAPHYGNVAVTIKNDDRKNCKDRNGHPRFRSALRNEIRELFLNDPKISFLAAAAQTSVSHSTVWNVIRSELRLYPYKLQMSTAMTEHH